MELQVGYDRAQPIGATAAGWRGVYPVDGGTVTGERVNGTVQPGGADWVTQRSDGVMVIDVRLTLATDDGAVIGMTYTGLARGRTPELTERFRRRELLGYDDFYLRTTPRFETGDARYAWLNGLVAVANGERTATGGRYQVFAIT
ncbi:DUF3237 family protein [Modestobacter sp. I12A-02628]|uniref:UPF0311 protein G1H19_15545 n=2 Tax=Goekera deserti TaxID=2497753 RepID=A0A7K3WG97_9ACTN|nr:DUF3237 family protein [Goekera deserti]NDI47198.1 DUF3237 family protein [Goekera deserti]NEL55402.1 DUF3237 domain-containing protein [Goekera deserti]